MKNSILKYTLAALGMLAVAFLVTAEPAFAQIPDFGSVESTIQSKVSDLVSLVKNILALMAAMYGLFEAFKAAKGDSKGWIKAFALLLVAAIIFAPDAWLRLFGFDALAGELKDWGF